MSTHSRACSSWSGDAHRSCLFGDLARVLDEDFLGARARLRANLFDVSHDGHTFVVSDGACNVGAVQQGRGEGGREGMKERRGDGGQGDTSVGVCQLSVRFTKVRFGMSILFI